MAKHRRQGKKVVRNTAAVTATAAVATLTPMAAHAAEVVVPGTDFRMDVQGLEGVQGLANVPGVDNYVPSLKGQGGTDFAAAIANPQAQPFQTQSVGESILAAARSKIGSPYVWGATGPNAFDCSGLTSWAYNQVGKKIPRTSYGLLLRRLPRRHLCRQWQGRARGHAGHPLAGSADGQHAIPLRSAFLTQLSVT